MNRLLLIALLLLTATPATAADASVRYPLGLLTRGPGWTAERTAQTDSIQAGHMANMVRMANAGVLVAAGPFAGGHNLEGVFVFAPGATALDSMLAADPAIASRRLECTLVPWIAPPGLGEDYRRRAEGLDRVGMNPPDSMVTFGWAMIRRGPRYDSNPTPAAHKLLARHVSYIAGLRANGTLVFAGDIEGTGELRGVLVLMGDSAQVARAVHADPAVRAGRYAAEILRWWTAWGNIPGH